MGTLIVLLVVIGGLLLLPAFPLAGVAVLAMGYGASRLVGRRSEDAFIAALMVLGALGALGVFVRWFTATL